MNEILFAAKLSQLVYSRAHLDSPISKDALERLGITQSYAVVSWSTGTEAMLCVEPGRAIIHIVVRGSEKPFRWSGLQDWINNFLSIKTSYFGIRAHMGYARAASSILEAVEALLQQKSLPSDYRITVQGHSLGASVGVLLAVALGYTQRIARFNAGLTLITFGQRRVASTAHLTRALHCRYIRVQNGSDIACSTPALPGYGDHGTVLYFPNDRSLGPAIVDPSAWLKVRDRWLTGTQRLRDHSMAQYEQQLASLEATHTPLTIGDRR